jgi:hypothetical protein
MEQLLKAQLKEKLQELVEELQKARKPEQQSKKKQPGVPPQTIDPEDHPPTLSHSQVSKLIGKAESSEHVAKQDMAKDESKAANPHMGRSVFTMDHVNEVAAMKDHKAAKARAHEIVDASSANTKNRAKIKQMIDSSKDPSHLAMGMSNHTLAHPSEGLKVTKGESPEQVDKEMRDVAKGETCTIAKNGQWSLS